MQKHNPLTGLKEIKRLTEHTNYFLLGPNFSTFKFVIVFTPAFLSDISFEIYKGLIA